MQVALATPGVVVATTVTAEHKVVVAAVNVTAPLGIARGVVAADVTVAVNVTGLPYAAPPAGLAPTVVVVPAAAAV